MEYGTSLTARCKGVKNRYEKRGDHAVIFANRKGIQHEILIDEADFEIVSEFPGTWHACKDRNTFYAQTDIRDANGKRKTVKMQRVILNPPADMQVDHKNHNGLDNRRENIRIVTHGENQRNRIDNIKFQSDVDGVRWNARHEAWHAHPSVNGKKEHLGYFDIMIEAEATVCMFLETGMRVKRSDPRRTSEFQSKVPGVRWDSGAGAWRAQPQVNGKQEYLGLYDTEIEAEATVCMFLETGLRVKCSGRGRVAM